MFNKLLKKNKKDVIRLVGCHDGITARMVEEVGFEGIWSSGFTISASHCVPDASVLTKTEFLERAIEMKKASNLPILVDMDTGYGTATHMKYYIRDFENAGIDGVCIEDKRFPKTNSYIAGGQDQEDAHNFQMKLLRAKEAQRTKDFWVVARIESLICNPTEDGLEDALFRASAFAEAGADAILIHSKSKDGKDIKQFLLDWEKKCPIIIVPTSYPDAFVESEMKELGIDIVIYANQLMRAMVMGGLRYLNAICGYGIIYGSEDIVNMQKMFELQGMPGFKKREKESEIYGDKE